MTDPSHTGESSMPDQPQAPAQTPEMAKLQEDTAQVLQTIAGALGHSLSVLGERNEAANAALMGFAVILTAMPEVAALRAERVAAVLGALIKGSEAEQRAVANFVTGLVNVSREVP